jgi:putative ABC transport system ATP-binding protein
MRGSPGGPALVWREYWKEASRCTIQLLRAIALDASRVLIIVTHDARIFAFADRIAMMDDGRIMNIVHEWRA